jgi:hypothetical protein
VHYGYQEERCVRPVMKLDRDTSESEAIITRWIGGGGGAAVETFRFRSLC